VPGDRGCYSRLATPGAPLAERLAGHLVNRVPGPPAILLHHDGSAAATFYAGSAHTAVITVGTALGIGFAPPAGGLRPLAKRLEVRAAL
jgi:hypothetical protein